MATKEEIKEMLKDSGTVVIVTDNGCMATTNNENELLAMLMYAYLKVWCDTKFEVNIVETANRIMDVLGEMRVSNKEEDLAIILSKLFRDVLAEADDDEDEEATNG